MAKEPAQTKEPGILETLGSLQFGIVVLIAIAIVSIIGTIIPQGQPYDFYDDVYSGPITAIIRMFNFNNTYRSALFIGLLGLFGLNLLLCSVLKFPRIFKNTFNPDRSPVLSRMKSMDVYTLRKGTTIDAIDSAFSDNGFRLQRVDPQRLYGEKGRYGRFGAFTVHLSLLVLLVGGVASLLTGARGRVVLRPGESTDVATLPSREALPLGFEIELERFDVSFYEDHPNRPKSFSSKVRITTPDGNSFDHDIRVNHPFMIGDLTVYQSSYGLLQDEAAQESSANDSVRVAIRMNGAPQEMPPITTVSLAMGEQFTVPGFGDSLVIEVTEIHRNFSAMGGQTDGANPAARFAVLVNGEPRWSVYAFVRFPGMNMPMDANRPVAFELQDVLRGDVAGMPEQSAPQYYTVLGVTRDSGTTLMWIGSLIMMIGLVLSFYIRPRRIWACAEGENVHVSGTIKGETDSFRSFVRNTAPGKHISE